jgi:S-adenosylmethionine-dependent methyltransferase
VISVNRYSIPYQTAFMRGELSQALAQVDARTVKANIFEAVFTTYSAGEIAEILESAGFVVEQDYGIRCLCDYWGDNERKSAPEVFEQIRRLEFALTDRHPYKLIARYYQVVARKA